MKTRRAFFAYWLLLQAATGFLSASEVGPYPMRITMRHIEPNGIGYTQGYTTLEGFFAPGDFCRGSWLPYLDLRGHVFDHGNLAANAGLGLRYLGERRVWGANAYYDYRNTHRLHYNQAALGFEMLGERWDFRINGYLPVGKKRSHGFSLKFDHFAGHNLFLSRKHEYALASVDSEVAYHMDRIEWLPVEVAAGPYYLRGNDQTAWGGKLRAALDFDQYFRLEGNVSYDNLFKWIGQGQASIIIPFGPRKRWTCRTECEEVPKCLCKTLVRRAYQRVVRSEIVPVDTKRRTQVAIDPTTGAPFFFVFVDNLSGSDGTFEDPYATLAAAQANSSPHNIIYVFTGNGTATGMNSGIVLKDFQQLLGSSVTHSIATTQGVIAIPSLTSTLPIIGNTGGAVVAVANGNTISGLAINNLNGTGISQSNAGITITDLTITNNAILSNTSVSRVGIGLNNVAGQMIIDHNEIGVEQSGGISLTNASISNASYTITNNSIAPAGSGSGVPVTLTYTNSSGIITQVANNNIESVSSAFLFNVSASNSSAPASEHIFAMNSNTLAGRNEINVALTNAARMSITLDSNNISSSSSVIAINAASTSSVTFLCKNNNIYGEGNGIFINLTNSASGNIIIDNNVFEYVDPINMFFRNSSTAQFLISNNKIVMLGDGISGFDTGITISNLNTAQSTGSILNNTILANLQGFCVDLFSSSPQLCTWNVENNSFFGNASSNGIVMNPSGPLNLSILNNQFHQTLLPGIDIALSGGASRMKINNNQFFGNSTRAASIVTSGANTSLCLQFNDNIANPTQNANGSNPFIFTNTAPALFQLESSAFTNNEGYFTPTNITLVPPHTCE